MEWTNAKMAAEDEQCEFCFLYGHETKDCSLARTFWSATTGSRGKFLQRYVGWYRHGIRAAKEMQKKKDELAIHAEN